MQTLHHFKKVLLLYDSVYAIMVLGHIFSKLEVPPMKTWENYKEHVKHLDPNGTREIIDIEEQARIIGTIIEQRNTLKLSQRDLADICGIPQSSVARIESFQTTPNLGTLLKICRALGLKLAVVK